MSTSTYLGGALLVAPFVAVIATGAVVGVTAAVVLDTVGLARRLGR